MMKCVIKNEKIVMPVHWHFTSGSYNTSRHQRTEGFIKYFLTRSADPLSDFDDFECIYISSDKDKF